MRSGRGGVAGSRRGLALIIVLSVLAVIALLGVGLHAMTALDRSTSRNWFHTVQTRLIARAGLEDAVSRVTQGKILRDGFKGDADWIYFGNDMKGTEPEKRNVPVGKARRPSFAIRDAFDHVQEISVISESGEEEKLGVSGRLSGSVFDPEGSVYSVGVRDLSGSIHINDGVSQYRGNMSSVSQNLRRVLNALGAQKSINLEKLGDKVLAARPLGGFPSFEDFRLSMMRSAGWTDAEIDRLTPHVTVHAWVDRNVVNPVPLSAAALWAYPIQYERGPIGQAVYRRGPGKDHRNTNRAIRESLAWLPDGGGQSTSTGLTNTVYAMDELNPSYVEVVHRAPVNVNTASQEVLVALLADLKGWFILERRSAAPMSPSPVEMKYVSTNWVVPNFELNVPQNNYTWEYMGHTYSPSPWMAQKSVVETIKWDEFLGATSPDTARTMAAVPDNDEIGVLWSTPSIVVDPAGDNSAISAYAIAAELLKCRAREGEYKGLPFGGPFRTWAQFNMFCAHLVEMGILRDDRHSAPDERRQGAEAVADVLKANFNPNYHPNELNPDHTLYSRVDKTDLVVNSTEFCFLPTGYVSITAVGRMLQRVTDTSAVFRTVSQVGIRSTVKVHDMYRESTQRHFYLGHAAPLGDRGETNNGYTVESGPEADNGPLVYGEHYNNFRQTLSRPWDGYAGYSTPSADKESGWGYEYSGYLALPTVGGTGAKKNTNTLMSTPECSNASDVMDQKAGIAPSVMHSHFQLDDRLHYSQSSKFQKIGDPAAYRENAASLQVTGDEHLYMRKWIYNPATCTAQLKIVKVEVPFAEEASNFPDPGEELSGADGKALMSPYDPTDGTRFRAQRSFRLPMIPGAVADGELTTPIGPCAPSDLRVDGFYSERHTGLAYWIDEEQSFDTRKGTISFWFKPNFDPASTGKIRTIATVSKFHRANYYYRNPSPFTLNFFPAHGADTHARTEYGGAWPAAQMGNLPLAGKAAGVSGLSSISPASMVFHVAWSAFDGAGWDWEWLPPSDHITQLTPFEMERYATTPTLNSKVNSPKEADRDGLRAHRWTHITMAWNLLSFLPKMEVLVNGRSIDGSKEVYPGGFWNQFASTELMRRPMFSMQSFLDHADPDDDRWFFDSTVEPSGRIMENTLRLGEASTHSFGHFPRNFSSDGTYDELFVWTSIGANDLQSLTTKGAIAKFKQGRYYVPRTPQDCTWTSPDLYLWSNEGRQVPPAAKASPTGVTSADASSGGPGDVKHAPSRIELLGVSWTSYVERYEVQAVGDEAKMVGMMVDYKDADQPKVLPQAYPCARLFVETEGQTYPLNEPEGFTDDGFSMLETTEGLPVHLGGDNCFRYKVRFVIQGATPSSILLSSPVFDDVTIYSAGAIEFLDYQQLLGAYR